MSVTLILRKEEFKLEGPLRISEALKQLGLSPQAYLVLRNGELLNENETLHDGDVVKLVAVISGG